MNITRNNVDALNAVITIQVAKEDFAGKVETVLKNYKKNADIPGFRKGHVPMSLIKKQYEQAIVFDEVNKLLQESLSEYLTNEKIEYLGNPLPVEKEEIDWDAATLNFDFELGLAPEFNVDLEVAKDLTKYVLIGDDEMIEEQLDYIQKQYGKLVSKEEAAESDDLRVKVSNAEEGIENEITFNISEVRTKTNQKKFIGKKVGDEVKVSTKGLFEDEHRLMEILNIDHDRVHGLDVEVSFVIDEISTQEKAELNQELFDKLFGEGKVNSVDELKEKIVEDFQKQIQPQADQKFMNDVVEALVEKTNFDLPEEFLIKWLPTVSEKPMTDEEAREEFEKSEKGLRYQLIEAKIISNNNLEVDAEEVKEYASVLIKEQMAQFGQMDPSDEEIDNIVLRVLSNQEEAARISEQLMNDKILRFFNDNVKAQAKEVNYKDFVKEAFPVEK